MDIKTLGVAETKVLHLVGPDKKPLYGEDGKPLTVTIYGPGSRQYAQAQARNLSRTVEQMQRGNQVQATPEEKAQFLAECTKEFSANIEYDGLQGEALFRAVYADLSIGFIADQVIKEVGEWSSFMRASIAG